MATMIERRGLLVPEHTDTEPVTDPPEQDPAPTDGYTERVRELEAAAAEADRIRELPTGRVLDRRQSLAEADELAGLDAEDHARRLAAAGTRERADLAAQADSAAAKRALEANTNVRALALSRRRRRWSGIAWSVLVLAMAFTCVNVQRFAAAGTPPWSSTWLVAWGVDPLLSLLVVGLLLASGDLAVLGLSLREGRGHRAILAVEAGALGAALLMNVAPELTAGVAWQSVCLHVVVPLAGMGAALVLPIIQQRYSGAIAALYAPASGVASDRPDTAINLPEPAARATGEAELSAVDRKVLADVRRALDAGELVHPPTGHAVYKRVMRGRGDKARAYRVAAAVQSEAP
jgi:hypothetical protein